MPPAAVSLHRDHLDHGQQWHRRSRWDDVAESCGDPNFFFCAHARLPELGVLLCQLRTLTTPYGDKERRAERIFANVSSGRMTMRGSQHFRQLNQCATTLETEVGGSHEGVNLNRLLCAHRRYQRW